MHPDQRDTRGQVGVGTLIVFIAMVVVAAVASGVLINAAGSLQEKSAKASEESSDQVSNRVVVINAIGTDIDSTAETVGVVNLTVSLSPSAKELDLAEATIQWIAPGGTYALTHDSLSDGDGNFSVAQVKDDDDSAPVLNARDDRLRIDINATALGGALTAGDRVEIRITSRSGATTIYELQIPQSLSGRSSVRL